MKIIEIATGYTPIPAKIGAATEIVVENLIYGFNNAGIKNELIDIGFSGGETSKQNESIQTIVHYQKLPKWLNKIDDNGLAHYLRRIFYSIKVGFFLRKYLKNQDDKIVLHFHNQFNFFFFYLICKQHINKTHIKTIYTVHSPGWSVFIKIPFSLLFEKFSIKKSNFTIALTQNIRNQIITIIKGINPEGILVIPNGVNTNIFKQNESIIKEKTILNIGSICRRKNQLETIIILKDFLIQNFYVFKYAGKIIEHDYFNEINSFVVKNNLQNNVQYLGEIKPGDNLIFLYNSSKIYISNSKSEAFNLVILESLSCGLPVILSTDFEQSLSAIKNDTFLQISSNDQFIEKITFLIEDEVNYKKISGKAQKFIKNNFSWRKIIEKYSQTFNKF